MKKTGVSKISELSVDAVDSLFVAWLRHRGVYSAFRSNCAFGKGSEKAFRSQLRTLIQNALRYPFFSVGDLVSMCFLFSRTPEGLTFWFDVSFAWRRFCVDFRNNFK